RGGQRLLNFAHGRRAQRPQRVHDLQLQSGQFGRHGAPIAPIDVETSTTVVGGLTRPALTRGIPAGGRESSAEKCEGGGTERKSRRADPEMRVRPTASA